jgi:Chalcone isomerase-like
MSCKWSLCVFRFSGRFTYAFAVRSRSSGFVANKAGAKVISWLAFLVIGLIATCSVSVPARANVPTPLPDLVKQAHGADLRALGAGRFRWFGLHIYDAVLWVSGNTWAWNDLFVLDIKYARDLVGRRITDASVDEVIRLRLVKDANKLESWREMMKRAFPDVKKGQHITGVYLPGTGATFYHEGRVTETVNDIEFARAFFSIWLDPRTREPKLRARQLGLP